MSQEHEAPTGRGQLGWDDLSLQLSEPKRIAQYRRLQSWYRETQLGARYDPRPSNGRPVGNRLDPREVTAQPDLNFLWPAAAWHVEDRLPIVQAQGGQMEGTRLRGNLMSSMPMCFNLFGALGTHPAFIDLFKLVFDAEAAEIIEVLCEWAPQPKADYLDDRSAFDALVRYRKAGGAPAFLAVETKYTDSFSPTEYDKPRYREVTVSSPWFTDDPTAPDRLKVSAANQMWRNTMLAASVEADGELGVGSVAVVCTHGDTAADKAVSLVQAEMGSQSRRLFQVDLESIVDAARLTGDADLTRWADRFQLRYLDLAAPDVTDAVMSPNGPRLGRPLVAPNRIPANPPSSVSATEVEAMSWQVAAEFLAGHPDWVVIETHPGGGQYDCLTLFHQRGTSTWPHIVMNRYGSITIFPSDHVYRTVVHWRWEFPWGELADRHDDDAFGARLLEHHAGLPPSADRYSPSAISAMALAQFLSERTATGAWSIKSLMHDSSGMDAGPIDNLMAAAPDAVASIQNREGPLPGQTSGLAWLQAIRHDEEAVAVADLGTATVWNRSGLIERGAATPAALLGLLNEACR